MTVNGFTALGLVEMTRKRTRESLAQIFVKPAPPVRDAEKSGQRKPSVMKFCVNCYENPDNSMPKSFVSWLRNR